MLAPTKQDQVMGHAEIRQVIKVSKVGNIAGCMVSDGVLQRSCKYRLIREGTVVTDGLTLDSLGNLYVTANTAEGVWVYAPDGTLLVFIGVPEAPANCAWGGPGTSTLFITANTGGYRLPMKVAGQPLPTA